MISPRGWSSLVLLALVATTGAASGSLSDTKLVVVDRVVRDGKAKLLFVAKDGAVEKGGGTDPSKIGARLDVVFDGTRGTFAMPAGPWQTNTPRSARYANDKAPDGGHVRSALVKEGKLIRVVAKGIGDTAPLDVSAAPSEAVYVSFAVDNDGTALSHCTRFDDCVHRTIAGGTGWKLACAGGDPVDGGCLATSTTSTALPSTTSTSTSTTLTSTTISTSTTLPLQVAYAPDCCQAAEACVAGYGASSSYYLQQLCDIDLPGSTAMEGGVCGDDGQCEIQYFEPTPVCCQMEDGCRDSGPYPPDTTAELWYYRASCVAGGESGWTLYFDAVCGPGGFCVGN